MQVITKFFDITSATIRYHCFGNHHSGGEKYYQVQIIQELKKYSTPSITQPLEEKNILRLSPF